MKRESKKIVAIVAAFFFVLAPLEVYALPEGLNKFSGDADFDWSQTNELHVNQNSDKLIVEYKDFSIGLDEGVFFHQPSSTSAALNKVVGIDPSSILGHLEATGQIFLINPNGIVFGPGSTVDAAGIVASTLDMSYSDFIDGIHRFTGQGSYVLNQGLITSPGGYVALLGASVMNTGIINAQLGSVVLASGEAMTLSLDARGLINVVIDKGTTLNPNNAHVAVKNLGTIHANGGKVLLTAKILSGVFDKAINNEGIIEAEALIEDAGEILLLANKDIEVGGQLRGGKVSVITQEGHVAHLPMNEVTTKGDNFLGFAKLDYTVGNNTIIDVQEGVIDIFAGNNVYLGSHDTDELLRYEWEYITDTRGYALGAYGYYDIDQNNDLVYVPFVIGPDIGKDGVSQTEGTGLVYRPLDYFELYTVFNQGANTYVHPNDNSNMSAWLYHTEEQYNDDGLNHVVIDGERYRYGWEDIYGLGDADFDDAVIDFTFDVVSTTPGALLNSLDNIFITAKLGEIYQVDGGVNANNLMLKANTGISGTSPNSGLRVTANALTAYNGTSGGIQLENMGDLIVDNLSFEPGLNPGVIGGYEIYNGAPGGLIDLLVHGNLTLFTPIIGHGDIVLVSDENIVQLQRGNIYIQQRMSDVLNPPSDVHSTSHDIAIWTNEDLFEVEWGLPEAGEGLYQYTATADKGYEMAEDTLVHTSDGDATILANDDIILALVDAGNGNVQMTSHLGSIVDGDLSVVPNDYDVIARHIDLQAPNGEVGTLLPEEEIDLGYAMFDFSYVFDTNSFTIPDNNGDPYDVRLTPSGDWVFSTALPVLFDNDNWNFHILAAREAMLDRNGFDKAFAGIEEAIVSDTVHVGPYYVDMTKPVILAGRPIGLLGSNGIYQSSVSVPFNAEDNMSGFPTEGFLETAMATKTVDGPGIGLFVTSDGIVDRAGNIADPITVGPFDILFPNVPQTFENMIDELRVYYEILEPSQFVSVEPAQKIGLYAYHPITETDASAFDDLTLDVGAYEFIEEQLRKKDKR